MHHLDLPDAAPPVASHSLKAEPAVDPGIGGDISLPATPRSAGTARAFVRDRAAAAGFAGDGLADIEVAVGEAITNAIEHGNGRRPSPGKDGATPHGHVHVRVSWDGEAFRVMVADHGPGFNPDLARTAPHGDGVMERGRGLLLMGVLMDEVEFERRPEGMAVHLTHLLRRDAPGAD